MAENPSTEEVIVNPKNQLSLRKVDLSVPESSSEMIVDVVVQTALDGDYKTLDDLVSGLNDVPELRPFVNCMVKVFPDKLGKGLEMVLTRVNDAKELAKIVNGQPEVDKAVCNRTMEAILNSLNETERIAASNSMQVAYAVSGTVNSWSDIAGSGMGPDQLAHMRGLMIDLQKVLDENPASHELGSYVLAQLDKPEVLEPILSEWSEKCKKDTGGWAHSSGISGAMKHQQVARGESFDIDEVLKNVKSFKVEKVGEKGAILVCRVDGDFDIFKPGTITNDIDGSKRESEATDNRKKAAQLLAAIVAKHLETLEIPQVTFNYSPTMVPNEIRMKFWG